MLEMLDNNKALQNPWEYWDNNGNMEISEQSMG